MDFIVGLYNYIYIYIWTLYIYIWTVVSNIGKLWEVCWFINYCSNYSGFMIAKLMIYNLL